MMSSEKEILTLTFPFNVLIGHQKEMMTFIFTLNVLIGLFNSHMVGSFAYLTKRKCLLCNSHRGPCFVKYNPLFG